MNYYKFCCAFSIHLFLVGSTWAQQNFYSHVAEIKIFFKEDNWSQVLDSLYENFGEEQRLKGDVEINGKTFRQCGIRYKGFSSWAKNQKKNPFNIDLDYTYKNNNYQGYKKIKLSNVIHDPSFVREVLAYDIAKQFSYAPEAGFACVYVNNVYIGLYTNVEAIDKTFLKTKFGHNSNPFFKGSPSKLVYPFGQNSNLSDVHGDDSSNYFPYYKIESEYGWKALVEMIHILNSDSLCILDNFLNIDKTLWMHAFNYAIVNLDSYIGYAQNYYLYQNSQRSFEPILWDLNMSFGSFKYSDGITLNLSVTKAKNLDPLQHIKQTAFSPRPLIKKILINPRYQKMYIAHLRTIIDSNFSNNRYYDCAVQYQNIIDQYVINDTNKFYSYEDFKKNIDFETGSSFRYPGLKDFMEARVNYLNSYPAFRGEPVLQSKFPNDELFYHGDTIHFEAICDDADSLFIFFKTTFDNPFTSLQMIKKSNEHNVFVIDIPLISNHFIYHFWAENDSAGSFHPAFATFENHQLNIAPQKGEVFINELIISNSSTIEFYAPKKTTLKGHKLMVNEFLFDVPETTIMENSFFTFDIDLSTFYSNSVLKIDLIDARNCTIDNIQTPLIFNENSIGRYPDGTSKITSLKPTPGSYNQSSQSNSFCIYPNPTSKIINIELFDCEYHSIEIIDINGKLVYNEIKNDDIPCLAQIDISWLEKGTYVLKINKLLNYECKKLVVQ